MQQMVVSSKAFADQAMIPAKHTCDGADICPDLKVENVPANTKTLVLIMDDPDSPTGTWVHSVCFNIFISDSTLMIEEGCSPVGVTGKNSWNNLGYGGPCPGSGEHRYIFKFYALDQELPLEAGATKEEVEIAMQDHIIAEGQLVGRYERLK